MNDQFLIMNQNMPFKKARMTVAIVKKTTNEDVNVKQGNNTSCNFIT